MTSINISIRKEAYDFLNSLKSKNKSFSEVILDLKNVNKNKNNDIMQFFGVLKDLDWKEKEKKMKKLRGSFNNRLK